MKVLSIKEPSASLINEKIKRIETRSFRTNYRGELYIHASLAPMTSKRMKREDYSLLGDNYTFSYGHIICKCNLVDCIYMTKEYVEEMKKNDYQEYICGLYEEGRYAWIIDDVIPLDTPIKAKGKLGIWNFEE